MKMFLNVPKDTGEILITIEIPTNFKIKAGGNAFLCRCNLYFLKKYFITIQKRQ